jgi:hypothetical protein
MNILHFNGYSRQVELINAAIDKAKIGSYLHCSPHVADPSEEIQEVLIACVEWNMETRAKDIPEADLPALQQKAVDLLDLLKKNLSDKTGKNISELGCAHREHSMCTPCTLCTLCTPCAHRPSDSLRPKLRF